MNIYLYNDKNLQTYRRNLRSNITIAERKLWQLLRSKQIQQTRFLRQYSVGAHILDFYAPAIRLGLEIDGGQHNEIENFEKDIKRTIFLKEQNIAVIRFWNNEIFENIEGAILRIEQEIIKRK